MKTTARLASAGLALGILLTVTAGTGVAFADENSPKGSGVYSSLRDTITREEWRAVKTAVRAAHEEAHDALRTAALAPLVADGTLTAAEADEIVSEPRRLGLRELIVTGAITRAEAVTIREALRNQGQDDHAAVLAEALAGLVADGTLTQAQADAITAAAEDGRLGGGRRGQSSGA